MKTVMDAERQERSLIITQRGRMNAALEEK